MKYMKRRGLKMFAVAALLPMMALAQAPTPASAPQGTKQEVTQFIREFLANVPKNDPAVFQEFFADDVIYTRATGVTVTKADIIKNIDVRAAADPKATYEGVDFLVNDYGDKAVANFVLVMHNIENGNPVKVYYRNTGTFLKRGGKWQAVAWQATKIEEEKKQESLPNTNAGHPKS
ncbi:MAG TPA: nuclear transport factor 2 family protein [Candidatus Acidoferrales bacterium]|nr:nuclear transport factor 2 family protein [Candidatus Acidoferrales bacterium]